MPPPSGIHSGGKDLQDLRGLSRAPAHSWLRRMFRPNRPRAAGSPKVADYPALAAFAASQTRRWLNEYFRVRFGRRHPFSTYGKGQTGIHRLVEDGGEVRLALAGDWGTGTDEAAMVAARMRDFTPGYTIHLGDVYYVGDREEMEENVFGLARPGSGFKPVTWPLGSHGSFALLGNHEMYARGYAYFNRMLPRLGLIRNGQTQGQAASYFCLETEHWRLIAVDTGYNSVGWPLLEYTMPPDCAVPQPVLDWLNDVVQPDQDNDPRGIVLITHHQAFSRFDEWCPKPARQLAPFFTKPLLWFWGHEHRLTVYEEFTAPGGIVAHARCIGHGGMPIALPPAQPKHPQCEAAFIDTRLYPNDEHLRVGYNGFARLTLKGAALGVDYVDLHGDVLFSEAWEAGEAGLRRSD